MPATKTRLAPTSITVIGRRWFQKSAGNTYYTAEIYVDGEPVHQIPRAYGYGDQYLQDSFAWLEENGHIAPEYYEVSSVTEAPWRYCERVGCKLINSVSDVARQSDL